MIRKILALLCISVFSILVACGGGGGGGSAGQQSVLKVVNSTTNAEQLRVNIDNEAFFDSISIGQASVFKEVLAGDRMLLISELSGDQRTLELQNEFAFGVPYTIIVTGSDSQLTPIVALNDRSDTPPAQFRVRAINASKRAGAVTVRLVPGTIGRRSSGSPLTRATTPTPAATSNNSSAEASPTATATPLATATPEATVSTQVTATPTASPTAQASATSTPTASDSPIVASTVSRNLNFQEKSDYILVPQSDYRIEVEASGSAPSDSGVITFSGGQIITIVIRDQAASEGGGTAIQRLDDKP